MLSEVISPGSDVSYDDRLPNIPPPHTPAAPASHSFRRVLSAVSERFGEPDLSLGILSREAGISERHLARLFKQHLDKPFRQYLRETRVNAAAALLARSQYEVKTIAGLVGYLYPSRFGRDFRLLMKCTPAQYRVKHTREMQSVPQRTIDIAMSDL